MTTHPAWISEAGWAATPVDVRAGFLEVLDRLHRHQQEIHGLRPESEQLRAQLTALATELAELPERIGRTSRNSSKPASN